MNYTMKMFIRDIPVLAEQIKQQYKYIYCVPRGGLAVGMALGAKLDIPVISSIRGLYPSHVLVVDDVIDSGDTRMKYTDFDFACLHTKRNPDNLSRKATYYVSYEIDWIEYWWEAEEKPAEDAVTRMIQAIGDDPTREGLQETPGRVTSSWKHLYSGYAIDTDEEVQKLFKKFSSDGYNEMVLLRDIEFYSMCEHHMLPFFGKAHIAYLPKEKVVGISKLARLLEIHSRKLQIQERIGESVTKDIMKHLDAGGAACIIEAEHLCMKMRGVEKQNSIMTTSSLKGAFLNQERTRTELMVLIRR